MVAVALGRGGATQCPFCIDTHTKAAHRAGATPATIAESAMVAAALRARRRGNACLQAMKTMKELGDASWHQRGKATDGKVGTA